MDIGSGGVVDGLLDKVTVFVTIFNEACLLHGRPLVFETFMLLVFSHSVWAVLLIIAPFNVLVCWEIEASCALWPFFLFHFLHGRPLGCTTVPTGCCTGFVSGDISCFVCAHFPLGTGLLWNTFSRENSVFTSMLYLVSSFLTKGSGDVAVPISHVFRCGGEVAFSLCLVIIDCDFSLVAEGCHPTLGFFCLGLNSSSVLLSIPYFA